MVPEAFHRGPNADGCPNLGLSLDLCYIPHPKQIGAKWQALIWKVYSKSRQLDDGGSTSPSPIRFARPSLVACSLQAISCLPSGKWPRGSQPVVWRYERPSEPSKKKE